MNQERSTRLQSIIDTVTEAQEQSGATIPEILKLWKSMTGMDPMLWVLEGNEAEVIQREASQSMPFPSQRVRREKKMPEPHQPHILVSDSDTDDDDETEEIEETESDDDDEEVSQ